jgi:hypothetical protein
VKSKSERRCFIVIALPLLGGCAVWPNYQRPAVNAPEIPAGLPSGLLRRRPDVLAAEHSS